MEVEITLDKLQKAVEELYQQQENTRREVNDLVNAHRTNTPHSSTPKHQVFSDSCIVIEVKSWQKRHADVRVKKNHQPGTSTVISIHYQNDCTYFSEGKITPILYFDFAWLLTVPDIYNNIEGIKQFVLMFKSNVAAAVFSNCVCRPFTVIRSKVLMTSKDCQFYTVSYKKDLANCVNVTVYGNIEENQYWVEYKTKNNKNILHWLVNDISIGRVIGVTNSYFYQAIISFGMFSLKHRFRVTFTHENDGKMFHKVLGRIEKDLARNHSNALSRQQICDIHSHSFCTFDNIQKPYDSISALSENMNKHTIAQQFNFTIPPNTFVFGKETKANKVANGISGNLCVERK